jgi:acyl-coenzyme A synthetase/AMP-(fatty) acid ligase
MPAFQHELAGVFSEHAQRPFFVDAATGRELTFADTLDIAATWVEELANRGIARGDRLGLELRNGVDFALLYMMCLVGGFVAVPINSSLSHRDRAFIIERSRLKAFITDDVPHQVACPVLRVGDGCLDSSYQGESGRTAGEIGIGESGIELLRKVDSESLLAITFTSGSTSMPKGVPHCVGGLLGNAVSFNHTFHLSRDHRFLHVMPMGYMAGLLNTLLCPLMAGAAVVIAPQFSAAAALNFWDPVVRYGADVFWLSPTMLATLVRLDRGSSGTGYLKERPVRVFSATAPLPMKIRREFEAKYGTSVVESYGLSELLLITANLGPSGTKDYSVGVAIPEAAIEIRNEAGNNVPIGTEGLIYVRTPFRSIGYLDYDSGQPVATVDQWVDTGDIGHLDSDGYLYVTGRQKDLIIRGGFNISPRAIEEALLTHTDVENVAVLGAPHEFYGEMIVAAVAMRTGAALPSLEPVLRELCRKTLGDTMVPDRFVEVCDIPLSTTGKIQKGLLRSRILSGDPS